MRLRSGLPQAVGLPPFLPLLVALIEFCLVWGCEQALLVECEYHRAGYCWVRALEEEGGVVFCWGGGGEACAAPTLLRKQRDVGCDGTGQPVCLWDGPPPPAAWGAGKVRWR